MSDRPPPQMSHGDTAARQLANATKSVPMMSIITPRWLPRCLQWLPVEAGIFRLNKVRDVSRVIVDCSPARDEHELPEVFVDYEENPREYNLSAVTTVVDIHSRVSDLYSVPHNQIATAASPDHRGDQGAAGKRLINSTSYGLLSNVTPSQTISTRTGSPHAGRRRRTHHEGLEATRLLPGASHGDRGVRAGVHPLRRAATHGEHVRLTLRDLARHSTGAI
jgi:hypothetical protein